MLESQKRWDQRDEARFSPAHGLHLRLPEPSGRPTCYKHTEKVRLKEYTHQIGSNWQRRDLAKHSCHPGCGHAAFPHCCVVNKVLRALGMITEACQQD